VGCPIVFCHCCITSTFFQVPFDQGVLKAAIFVVQLLQCSCIWQVHLSKLAFPLLHGLFRDAKLSGRCFLVFGASSIPHNQFLREKLFLRVGAPLVEEPLT
jgi:hypothetical protein